MLAVLTEARAIGRAALELERTLRAGCQKRRC